MFARIDALYQNYTLFSKAAKEYDEDEDYEYNLSDKEFNIIVAAICNYIKENKKDLINKIKEVEYIEKEKNENGEEIDIKKTKKITQYTNIEKEILVSISLCVLLSF